ncbi:MAG: hypothetical protein M3373_14740 [Gemmatimonadota bacterium]|nr:hypothetical protein [Gemmatimonadota bacterium]
MRPALLVALAVSSGLACSELVRPSAPADPTGTYVLARIEDQTVEPLFTFDHVCEGGIRVVRTLRDTITLEADGTARRATVSEWLSDGAPTPGDSHHRIATGRWGRSRPVNVHYYSDGPSIAMLLTPSDSLSPGYTMRFRLRGPDSLTNLGPIGGLCAGMPPEPWRGDSRTAEFWYVRQ